MKVLLEAGNGDFRNDSVNVVSTPVDTTKIHKGIKIVAGNFRNLDPVFKNKTIQEMVFSPPLNVIGPQEITKVIDHWKKKLTNKGVLKFTIINIRHVSEGIYRSNLSLEDGHLYIYGHGKEIKTLLDVATIVALAKDYKFNISYVSTNGYISSFELQNNVNDFED